MIRRTPAAVVLTAVAVAVPLLALYVTGGRAAARDAAAIRAEPQQRARDAAERLAQGLRERLDGLRLAESRRPYYHYQNLYHDPRGASSGASVVPSPLAQGPADPLVRAHFQVDARGRVTLPTLNEDGIAVPSAPERAAQESLRRELEPVATLCRKLVAATAPQPGTRPAAKGQQVERLENNSYRQQQMANRIFSDLKRGQAVALPDEGRLPGVEVRLGPLQWHTVTLAGAATPVALREVATPDGVLTQGFELSAATIERLLAAPGLPARFLPGTPQAATEAPVTLDASAWHVAVDAGPAQAEAQRRASEVEGFFRRAFLGVAFAALVAGVAVIVLVAQAETLARQRSQLAASAAHELRTPLAGLRLHAEMLAEGLGDAAKAPDYARRIAGEAERLGRVITNLLGFTRLERGTLAVDPRPGDLARAVEACVERQRPALEASGSRVAFDCEPDLPTVRFDPDALAQVVQNLLDNAEKYSRGSTERMIRVGLRRAQDAVVLSVSDRGPGIAPAVQRRLFRPFARGSGSDATAGLGLGLALVRALVRAHGGDVALAVSDGGGTTVAATFPAAPA